MRVHKKVIVICLHVTSNTLPTYFQVTPHTRLVLRQLFLCSCDITWYVADCSFPCLPLPTTLQSVLVLPSRLSSVCVWRGGLDLDPKEGHMQNLSATTEVSMMNLTLASSCSPCLLSQQDGSVAVLFRSKVFMRILFF